MFKLGPRRKPDDPFYDDFERLGKALNDLKQVIIEQLMNDAKRIMMRLIKIFKYLNKKKKDNP